jgi:hypothetical protein
MKNFFHTFTIFWQVGKYNHSFLIKHKNNEISIQLPLTGTNRLLSKGQNTGTCVQS